MRAFLEHTSSGTNYVTGEVGSPLDFTSFHAKGGPRFIDGHVQTRMDPQLSNVDGHMAVITSFPEYQDLPMVIGEADPEGCAACSARVHPQNGYRNGPLYGAYVIESMLRTDELARRAGVTIEGAVTWAFLFDGQPFFDGFRDLATNGIDKAVLNAFRMLGMLGGEWLATESSHALDLARILQHGVRAAPDINAAATRDATGASILLWNYHDDDLGEDAAEAADDGAAEVTLTITGLPAASLRVRHFRMDRDHGNAFAVWQRMGSPQTLEGAAYDRLEAAGKLALLEESTLDADGGQLSLRTHLPRHGASLFRLTWHGDEPGT